MTKQELEILIQQLSEKSSVKAKLEIEKTYSYLGKSVLSSHNDEKNSILLGDDCAAIPNGDDYLLFAAEGIITSFTEKYPWFAGYSSVMVNISDVCAMGGMPIAITDVLWSKNKEHSAEVWEGMKAASDAYNVPIVGGHTCYNEDNLHLAVSILGKAQNLITSFDAEPEDRILMVVDMDGAYFEDYPFWNSSVNAHPEKLRRIIQIPQALANSGVVKAGKDISMGGLLGTLSMLLKTSKVGADVCLDRLVMPDDQDMLRWLLSFPSYGYLFIVKKDKVDKVFDAYANEDSILVSDIGKITQGDDFMVIENNNKFKFE